MAKKDKKSKVTISPELAAFAKKHAKDFVAGKAEAASGGNFQEYPDSFYFLALTDTEIGQSENSGRWQIKYEWTILDGDYAGQLLFNYQGIGNPESIKWANIDIARLGEPHFDDVQGLQETLTRLIERRPKVRAQLKTTKGKDGEEYQNLRIKKLLEDLGVSSKLPTPSKKKKKKKKDKSGDVTIEGGKDKKKKKKKKKGK